MSLPLLKSGSAPQFGPECPRQSPVHRMLWAVLPVMLALVVIVLRFFGASWWTALLVALLLACPAAVAMCIYTCFYCKPGAAPVDGDASHGAAGRLGKTK
jgi:hypothetical protein